MKISIITVCYNSESTLEKTILSVANQTHKDVEYIIIDGNSKDGTVEIIKQYSNKIDHWISEPDKGLYDAMNKGIALATGEIIGILNSDDTFYSNNVLEQKNILKEYSICTRALILNHQHKTMNMHNIERQSMV